MPKKPRMSNVRTLGGDAAAWRGASLVSVEQLEPAAMDLLFATADAMKADVRSPAGGSDALRGKVLGNVFYEPSTRTNCSFQAAMLRLGGTTIAVNESTSSVAKGETLSDTVRSLESYCDALVLRHPTKGSAREAAEAMRKPLLNAGDGVGEHPTQALLDVFTIRSELASGAGAEGTALAALAGRTITMVGDLKHGRTVHSLAPLLARLGGAAVTLRFVAPASLRMPGALVEQVARAGATVHEDDALSDEVLAATDVLYVTRVQKERFDDPAAYEKVKHAFVVTAETLARMKETAVVMHPLPRVGEIAEECDADPRAAYFRQMENGMFVRMALLKLLLS